MSGKYCIMAKNYSSYVWDIVLYTDSRFKAIRVWIKALSKYELVEFTVRK